MALFPSDYGHPRTMEELAAEAACAAIVYAMVECIDGRDGHRPSDAAGMMSDRVYGELLGPDAIPTGEPKVRDKAALSKYLSEIDQLTLDQRWKTNVSNLSFILHDSDNATMVFFRQCYKLKNPDPLARWAFEYVTQHFVKEDGLWKLSSSFAETISATPETQEFVSERLG